MLETTTETVEEQIDVMIINDSVFMTQFLRDILKSSSNINVLDTSSNGKDAILKLGRTNPDVILLDLEMPIMDGLEFLESMTASSDLIPIIIVSSYSKQNAKLVLDSLEHGAVDFLGIPEDVQSNMKLFRHSLLDKIKIANESDPNQLVLKNLSRLKPKRNFSKKTSLVSRVVVIGASTGGPNMVNQIISELPADIPSAVIVVQHMPKGFTTSFAERLDKTSDLVVKEAADGDALQNGTVLVAPGDYHVVINPNHHISLNQEPKRFGVRPAVNVTMISATEVFGGDVIGVLLSGMGHDGAFGMKAIKKRGGNTIIQNKQTSVVFGMAKAAEDMGIVDHTLPIEKISDQIIQEITENE